MDIPNHLLNKNIVYHYTSSKVAIEAILGGGSLRFSALDLMNDPYEYKIASSMILTWGGLSHEENQNISRCMKKTILRDSKVACFARMRDETLNHFKYPFTKPRSWAQYGESQKGVCFGFDLAKLEKTIKSQFPHSKLYCNDVEYTLDNGIPSQKSTLRYDKRESIEGNVESHINAYSQDIYFRKYSDFKDEDEYRFVILDSFNQSSDYLYCPISDSLECIILGDRFPEIYHDLVKGLAEGFNAEAYQLKYSKSPYLFRLPNA